jgi:hypothetical protein
MKQLEEEIKAKIGNKRPASEVKKEFDKLHSGDSRGYIPSGA